MAAVGEAPGDGTLSVSEVSTRVECDLRLARPEEDWDLTGPVNGYSVGSWDYVMVARMGPFESSIGAQPVGIVRLAKGKTEVVNGQTVTGPLYIARPAKLKETSLVNHGADDTTSLHIAAKLFEEDSKMGFDAWLLAKGFDKATLSESQLAPLQAAFDAENKGESKDKNTPSVDAVLQAARDKEKRQSAYGTIIASGTPDEIRGNAEVRRVYLGRAIDEAA